MENPKASEAQEQPQGNAQTHPSQGMLTPSPAVEISGTVERIIFHNAENGYTVLRVLPDAGTTPQAQWVRESVSCVGHMINPQSGVHMKLVGQWQNNPRFGRQLAFVSAEEIFPATSEGIRLYLASGLIKGIGEAMAERIVKAFGTDTIRVLDTEPERLLSLRGIGKKTLERIRESWAEHQGMRDLLLFLQPHGISAAYAVRIYKTYGADALQIVRENPYRLAMDIHGIGFPTADAAASKLGFTSDHALRIQAGTLYLLQKATEDGHVYLPQAELLDLVGSLLGVEENLATTALSALEADERLVREVMDMPDTLAETGVYLRRFYHCESKTAFYLHRLLHSPKSVRVTDAEGLVESVIASLPLELAPEQRQAVQMAAHSKVMVLTGGPGTGKTTIINAIIRLFEKLRARILLAAPTGRAAKRMAETSRCEARTIHRLLEYSPKEDAFARNEDNPLACGLLVVDEASMMDTLLFYYLLKAVPLGATLVLVGDVNQLPSVGPGTVLADIIRSGVVPVVELTEIFRQSAQSAIISNAHMINRGEVPPLESSKERLSDFYFIRQNDPELVAQRIVELVRDHIPRRFELDPINDIQVLTPMHKGMAGAGYLNRCLQEALNPNSLEIRRGERAFRLHDKVMQIRNNYDKDVFNGDMGRITHMNVRERELSITFDDRVVPYEFDELDEIAPAYAISIHKSQGSEYPAVVIPLMMQHYVLLQRNLIYTGVTRGKKLVVLIGETRALHIAIKNNKTRKRYTRLAQRLSAAGM